MVEGIPFRLAASLILMAIIVSIVFSEINTYTYFQRSKQFADDVVELQNSMKTLSSVSDYGSFTKVHVVVPDGSNITFSQPNRMTVYAIGKRWDYPIPGVFSYLNKTPQVYKPGTYDILLYYGPDVPAGKKDSNTIGFKAS